MKRAVTTVARCALALAAASATALGCCWPDGTSHSVRFRWDGASDRDLSHLPPIRSALFQGLNDSGQDDRFWNFNDESDGGVDDEAVSSDDVWNAYVRARDAGDLRAARAKLADYLRQSSESTDDGGEQDGQQIRRNFAIDAVDALRELDRGASAKAVESYLNARDVYDAGGPREKIFASAVDDPRLTDNFAYLSAAVSYRDDELDGLPETFLAVASRFPRSEKRDAAIYMAGVAAVRCGDFAMGRAALARYLREYPSGRFEADAIGQIAYAKLRADDRGGALADYFRMAADPRDEVRRIAVSSLRIARPKATDEDLRRVETLLAGDRSAELAYAYYELYNYTPSIPNDTWGDDEAAATAKLRQRESFARVAAYATRVAVGAGATAFGAAFRLRAAMADLELGDDAAALGLARRALADGLAGEERARGLFVAGCAARQLGRLDEARTALAGAVELAHDERFAEVARARLATVAEDQGDLGAALEQYLAIDYQLDVAYLTDVLMSPAELERFVDERPDHPRRDEVLYAAALGSMRTGDFAGARRLLARVRPSGDLEDSRRSFQDEEYRNGRPDDDPKSPWRCDWHAPGVRERWIARDLQTMDDVEAYRRREADATTDADRAEAVYQLASYFYEGSHLLFYNPGAWRGFRAAEMNGGQWMRLPGEADLVWRRSREQETPAHALDLYLETARRYPTTRAAGDALVSAIFCDERLSDYNDYWRSAYEEGRKAGPPYLSAGYVRSVHPGYRLPIANALDWEPSTRTAGGEPAWPKPPAAKPTVPRWRRAVTIGGDYAWRAWSWTTDWVGSTVRRIVHYHVAQAWSGVFWLLFLVAAGATVAAAFSAYRLAGFHASVAAARYLRATAKAATVGVGRSLLRPGVDVCLRMLPGASVETEPPPSRSVRLGAWLEAALRTTLETRTGLALIVFLPPACLLGLVLLMLSV